MDELIGKVKVQQWEYYQWKYSSVMSSLEENLKVLGGAGWELVAIHHFEETPARYIFKRPKALSHEQ